MTTLVTGGAGYIGSHTVLALLEVGELVVVLDNLSTGIRTNLPKDIELVVGDIADDGIARQLMRRYRVDAIIHFAGSIVVADSVTDPLTYYLNNTVKSRALIASAIAVGVPHFIFSSTAAVYGTPEKNPIVEFSAPKPISPYGRSKLMTEVMLSDVAKAHNFGFVTLRYFNVAGADPAGRTGQSTPYATHLIKVACQTALGHRPYLSVYGTDYSTPDGTCIRDYVHVSDLAQAHIAALAYLRDGGASQSLNCGYGRGFSVFEVIEAVKRVSGINFAVHLGPRRTGDAAALVASSDLIRNTLGWRPQFADLDTVVRHAYAWETLL